MREVTGASGSSWAPLMGPGGRIAVVALALCLGMTVEAQVSSPRASGAKVAAPSKSKAPSYAPRADVQAYADELAQRHGWPRDWTRKVLADARYIESITTLIMPPPVGVPKNWAAYRERFIEPRRIAAGVAFWRSQQRALARAEREFGVPASLVIGIIGVETLYGRHTGGFRALDALATLSFDFPSGRSDRSAFFKSELEQLLVWARRERRDPRTVKGSYAGAIGLPQFMPGSINRHAIDFDGDGHIDLERSKADAVGSVARYMADHGWQSAMPTHYAVQPPADEQALATLLAPDIVPTFTAQQMSEQGAVLEDAALKHEGPLALVALQNGGNAPSYIAGTQNFYAVTRYNWSSYYALAVIELGAAVEKALREAPPSESASSGATPRDGKPSNRPATAKPRSDRSGPP